MKYALLVKKLNLIEEKFITSNELKKYGTIRKIHTKPLIY